MTTKEKAELGALLAIVAAIIVCACLPVTHAVFTQLVAALSGLLGLHKGHDVLANKLDAGAPAVAAGEPAKEPATEAPGTPEPPLNPVPSPFVEPAKEPAILQPSKVFAAIMPAAHPAAVAVHAPLAFAAMAEHGIDTPQRQAMFLANCAHECNQLRNLVEEWGPSVDQLKYEPPSHVAMRLGNTRVGDGRRFMGRGVVQLTGRGNYALAGQALGLDLEANPEVAATPEVAWRTAGWYWRTHDLSSCADAGDFEATVKGINGGLNGLAQRQVFYARACRALGVTASSSS